MLLVSVVAMVMVGYLMYSIISRAFFTWIFFFWWLRHLKNYQITGPAEPVDKTERG